jgi:4-amino-4-deoxy-L-arabinose transferase-like glycosyltransferase
VLLAAALRFFALADVPPGLYYDEAANGVDALSVLAGTHPVFFPGDQGREPLVIYFQALSIALVGDSPFALRLPSAFLGVLTVAATYATFRAFANRTVGLIGEGLIAVSFWHVSLSRLAFRTVALPVFSVMAAFWFWKGIRSGQPRHFALAGALLGVDLYTYIPARLAPILFAGGSSAVS